MKINIIVMFVAVLPASSYFRLKSSTVCEMWIRIAFPADVSTFGFWREADSTVSSHSIFYLFILISIYTHYKTSLNIA